MEKKLTNRTSLILSFSTALLIGCLSYACKINKSAANPKPAATIYIPIVIKEKLPTLLKQTRDTIPARKKMSEKEMQDYLASQYKLNYDKYFSPEFTNLNKTIRDLVVSNKNLSDMLNSVRSRSIIQSDQLKKEAAYWRTMAFRQDIKQTDQNTNQIKAVNALTNKLMIGIGFIVILVLGSYGLSFILWRKLKQLTKKI